MASRRSGKSTKANFNEKVVEDIRSTQPQQQASAVAKSSFDQSERTRLAQQQQASQVKLSRERATRATSQANAQQQQADRAKRLAEQIKQSQQREAQKQVLQRQNEAKQISRPINTTSISTFANSFTKPPERSTSKGRSSQFGQTVQAGSGKTLGEVRVATRRDIKTPQPKQSTLAVRQFLTTERVAPKQAEVLVHDKHVSRQGTPFAVTQAGVFGTPAPTLAEIRSVLPSKQNPFSIDKSVSVSERQIANPKAGEIISVDEKRSRQPDGSVRVDTTTQRQPEFLTETVRDTSRGIVEKRPDVNPNPFLGFLGGVAQEGVNFANIADLATGKGGIDPETGLPLEGTAGFTRKEVGSTVIDLPFAVGGALLTKERPAGEGFFGLGFDFDVSDKSIGRAQEAFGESSEFIEKEFARDPSRALGSTFAAVGIEVALLVGTAGTATVARKGIVKAGEFAVKTKQAQQVAKIAKSLAIKGEESLPRSLQSIGDNKYVLTVGTDALKGVGTTVVSPSRAIVTSITRAGKVVQTKIPLLKFGGKAKDFGRVKGAKTIKHKESDIQAIIKSKGLKPNPQNPKSARTQAIDELNSAIKIKVQGGVSQNPITIIDLGTKTRKPSVAITKRFVPKKATIEQEKLIQATVTNVQDSSRFLAQKEVKRTGLRLFNVKTEIPQFKPSRTDRLLGRKEPRLKQDTPIKEVDDGLDKIRALTGKKPPTRGESTTVTTFDGRLTDVAVSELKASEKLGLNKRSATSFVFALEDVVKNPQVIKKIVSTERGLTGRGVQLPKTVKGAEKLQRQGKIPKKQQDTVPISFSTRAVFESKSLGVPKIIAKGKNIGKGKTGQAGKGQAKPESIFDDFTKTNKGQGGSQTVVKSKAKAQVKSPTPQSLSAIRQDIQLGIRSGTKQGGKKIRTPFDPFVSATSVGTRAGIGVALASQQSQVESQKSRQVESTKQSEIFGSVLIPVSDTNTILDTKQKNRIIVPPQLTTGKTIVDEKQDFGNILIPIQEQTTVIKPEITTTTTPKPPTTTSITGFIPPPVNVGRNEAIRRAKEARARRPSKKGNRLFDVADTPFGEVEVGLGFFIEQKGDESIAEAIGTAPLKKKKKKDLPIDNVFDPSGLFSF